MCAHIRKLAEFPEEAISADILNFLIFYQKEVSTRLAKMQKGEKLSEKEGFFIRNCSYWIKMANRHAQKLFENENPDPETIEYKVTMTGSNTNKSHENPFPVVQELVLNATGNTKFMFRLPCTKYEDCAPEYLDLDSWKSFELYLDPKCYKPSRLTPKCVFWYFPEEHIFAIYSFTY